MTHAYQASLFDNRGAVPIVGSLGDDVRRIPLEAGAWIDLRPGWVANSDSLFEDLVHAVDWRADRREMYDRVVEVPRLVSHFGAADRMPHPTLDESMRLLNEHYAQLDDERFATAGLCFYRTGDDSVAWHGDRVGRSVQRDTRVAILSVGAERVLSVRPVGGGDTSRFAVGHGDLIVMGGSCQRTYEHAILKSAKAVGPRISVQFRRA
ncbi:alpha-ketoglutarate-dependent dioxygenase AlkB [Agreia sp.]|uniref:alpha-ketoglutarate-dependent dioxygenase AlkB n=1 Tax=Agreia sp. TaxID=1872416 RepID=UPI0035BC198F